MYHLKDSFQNEAGKDCFGFVLRNVAGNPDNFQNEAGKDAFSFVLRNAAGNPVFASCSCRFMEHQSTLYYKAQATMLLSTCGQLVSQLCYSLCVIILEEGNGPLNLPVLISSDRRGIPVNTLYKVIYFNVFLEKNILFNI